MILPGAQELFKTYLLPWYDGEKKPAGPRPETYLIKSFAGKPPAKLQHLRADYAGLLQDYLLESLPNAARGAYQPIVAFKKFDETVLAAVNDYYTPQVIAGLIADSNPADFANYYLAAVSYLGSALSVLFMQQGGFGWLYEHPYFNSVLVHQATGIVVPVFDWALSRLSADGVDDNPCTRFKAVAGRLKG